MIYPVLKVSGELVFRRIGAAISCDPFITIQGDRKFAPPGPRYAGIAVYVHFVLGYLKQS